MSYLFNKHYTLEQARRLLPQVRGWVKELGNGQLRLEALQSKLDQLMSSGQDAGGDLVNRWVRTIAEVQAVLMEFHRREIQVKDARRGLIDFPSLMGQKEVFLCWEEGEEDIEFWHEIDAGYAGRQRLE